MAKEGYLEDSDGVKYYPLPSWPIGSIYISVNNTNPKTYFGGTWVSFGTGRCLVGVDTSQTEFKTVEKTGGSKYLQKHSHIVQRTNQTSAVKDGYIMTGGYTKTGTVNINEEGTGNAGNLPPYITVYMWKRTA